jgi:hypothetical protein
MKKLLLTGIAALLLATGTAHAGDEYQPQKPKELTPNFGDGRDQAAA